MGGFGAVRYAQDRPDLFAYVASFSGAVDLGDSGTRSVITEQAGQAGFNPYGPFGNPFWPFDCDLERAQPAEPRRRACRASGVGALRRRRAATTRTCSRARWRASADALPQLAQRGRRAALLLEVRAGPGNGCDGGHNFGCWNFALNDAMPKIMAALGAPPAALRPGRRCRRRRLRGRRPRPVGLPGQLRRRPRRGHWPHAAPATAGSATPPAGTTSTRRSRVTAESHLRGLRLDPHVGEQRRRLLRPADPRRPGASASSSYRPPRRLHEA